MIHSLKCLSDFAKTLIFITVVMAWPVQGLAQSVYKFGIVPQFEPRKLAAIWSPILDELQRRTGLTFELVGSARIFEFEREFEAGDYDFAYMNPYHAAMAFHTQKYQPLVREGSEMLSGVLVTAKDGPIRNVKDLDGKTIAFPSPNSLGATMLVRADIDRQNQIGFTPMWAQTHTSAYLNAALGRADAAGGVMATLKQQPQAIQDKLRILMETRRVPSHPVVVHHRVPSADREKVRQAFLAMGVSQQGASLLAAVPIRKVVAASMADYAELGKMGLEKYYVKGAQ